MNARAKVVLLWSVALGACQSPPGHSPIDAAAADAMDAGYDAPVITAMKRCIGDWPAQSVAMTSATLAVEPKILWRKPIAWRPGMLLIYGNQLINYGFNGVFVLDMQGNLVDTARGEGWEFISEPTISKTGKMYFTGHSLYQYDLDQRTYGWRHVFAPQDRLFENSVMPHVVVNDEGWIFGVDIEGILRAWNDVGLVLWEQRVAPPFGSFKQGNVGFGIGDAVTAGWATSSEIYTQFYDTVAGTAIGRPAVRWLEWAGAQSGIVGGNAVSLQDPEQAIVSLFDRCGSPIGMLQPEPGARVIMSLSGDRLITARLSQGTYRLLNFEGLTLAGPTPAGPFEHAGADGILYGTRCTSGRDGPGVLVASNLQFQEVWRLPVDNCACHEALADSGVLYRACETIGVEAYLETIQTSSPGLDRGSRPRFEQVNNRNNNWISP